jgi:hypothetical protein
LGLCSSFHILISYLFLKCSKIDISENLQILGHRLRWRRDRQRSRAFTRR